MKPLVFTAILAAASLSACQSEPEIEGPLSDNSVTHASALVSNALGEDVGSVLLQSDSDHVFLALELRELEPGTKALHLHTTGACESPDFASAGGHLNPTGATHGELSEGGKHLGDLPNVVIAEDGQLSARINIGIPNQGILEAINDSDGTAVMLHAGPDDYISDPAGAAGPRIACGVLTPNEQL